jgi:hypothetical protein
MSRSKKKRPTTPTPNPDPKPQPAAPPAGEGPTSGKHALALIPPTNPSPALPPVAAPPTSAPTPDNPSFALDALVDRLAENRQGSVRIQTGPQFGIMSGIGMVFLFLAVVWFVIRTMDDVLSFYPIGLFVLGGLVVIVGLFWRPAE